MKGNTVQVMGHAYVWGPGPTMGARPGVERMTSSVSIYAYTSPAMQWRLHRLEVRGNACVLVCARCARIDVSGLHMQALARPG